ncbi:ATP synthase F1 subunit gamma [Microscilla marina]|uniref:ATP synthase gamma chain n=1 Tax=Microscilla marina ATCC 23134 TaxID=313606 RepID=A1ZKB6_MICM2|nr:ATP synthase F1 subunit gamma [Microscilla marina]EAY29142.1 ATP synthase F1, gamma subunit [Microscilla marina ATCC 23134]
MANLKEIRTRISTVKSTQQITKAMKMVAAAKLRRAQDAIEGMRPYASMLKGIIDNLSRNMSSEDLTSEFMEDRSPEKVLIIAITSDRGLCGAFNNNIIKAAVALAEDKYADQLAKGNLTFLTIGKKASEGLARREYKTIFPQKRNAQGELERVEVFQNLNFANIKDTAEVVLEQFKSGEIDRVEIIYNEFINVITQAVRCKQFLPISADSIEDSSEIKEKNSDSVDYLFEPSEEEIMEELIPKSLKIQLYSSILDSNAAEHGARMAAMDQATENAEELVKELKLTYNKSRQAAITKEILEIVGGAEALNA